MDTYATNPYGRNAFVRRSWSTSGARSPTNKLKVSAIKFKRYKIYIPLILKINTKPMMDYNTLH